jgi:hypothetical protein
MTNNRKSQYENDGTNNGAIRTYHSDGHKSSVLSIVFVFKNVVTSAVLRLLSDLIITEYYFIFKLGGNEYG